MPLPTETMEERFDKQFEGELWLGYVNHRRILPEDEKEDYTYNRNELLAFIQSELSLSQNRILEEVLSMQKVAINEQEEVRNPYTTKAFVLGEDGKFKLPPPAREIRNLKYVSVQDIIKLSSKKDN